MLVNPGGSRTVTVALEQPFLRNGQRVTSVLLGPHTGVILGR